MAQYEFLAFQTHPDNKPDEGAYGSRITGKADGRLFCVDVWCEHDGRDVDIELVAGHDVRDDIDFFSSLCEWEPWADALNTDYTTWDNS